MLRRYLPHKYWFIPLALSIYLLSSWAGTSLTHLIEIYYSRGIYPIITFLQSQISDLFTFSLTEVLFFALLGYLGTRFTIFFGRVWQRGWPPGSLRFLFLNTLVLLSIAYLTFQFLWGFNYLRQRLVYKLNLPLSQVTQKDIYHQAQREVLYVNRLYHQRKFLNHHRLNSKVEGALNQVIYDLEGVEIHTSQKIKTLQCNLVFEELGIDGVMIPFFSEAHFNSAILHWEKPYTIAHEKAHLKGYALEDEASFLAYLACVESRDPDLAYSARLSLLRSILFSLPPQQQKKIWNRLELGPQMDLFLLNQRLRKSDSLLSQWHHQLNHRFLQWNGVEKGSASYGYVVYLVTAYHKKHSPSHPSQWP